MSARASMLPAFTRTVAPVASTALESAAALGSALNNVGERAVFDNVNFFSKFLSLVRKLQGSQAERENMCQALLSITGGLDELALILVYIVSIERVLQLLWVSTAWLRQALSKREASKETSDGVYEKSLLSALSLPLRRYGWSLLLLWVVDAIYIVATIFDLHLREDRSLRKQLPNAISYVVNTYMLGVTMAAIKNWWLSRSTWQPLVRSALGSKEQRAIVRRGSGILLWSALTLMCAEGFSAATGLQLRSIFSVAGVGGIAIGLATKDLLTNLVGGCLLFISNPFVEKEKITMTNLEQSRILRVGWYRTVVLGDDEQVQIIPNARFISNKISNRSRRTHRCMKQSVFLTYDALPEADVLIDQLRAELRALPTIDAKTRNFRVYLKALTQTALEIEVELHFRGNDGTEFRHKRQEALLTIARVVDAHGARFAVLKSLLAEQGTAQTMALAGADAGLPAAQQVADEGQGVHEEVERGVD